MQLGGGTRAGRFSLSNPQEKKGVVAHPGLGVGKYENLPGRVRRPNCKGYWKVQFFCNGGEFTKKIESPEAEARNWVNPREFKQKEIYWGKMILFFFTFWASFFVSCLGLIGGVEKHPNAILVCWGCDHASAVMVRILASPQALQGEGEMVTLNRNIKKWGKCFK